MQASRIWPSVFAAVALGSVLAATVADARGGRSGGHLRAFLSHAPSATSPATIAPAETLQPAAAATKSSTPSINLNTVGAIPTPQAPAAAAPAPQTAAPIPQRDAIAPLSSSTAVPTTQTTGGSSGVALPETPGGGREGLQACLEFWDSATHMTRAEWRAACQRSAHRLQGIAGPKKQ